MKEKKESYRADERNCDKQHRHDERCPEEENTSFVTQIFRPESECGGDEALDQYKRENRPTKGTRAAAPTAAKVDQSTAIDQSFKVRIYEIRDSVGIIFTAGWAYCNLNRVTEGIKDPISITESGLSKTGLSREPNSAAICRRSSESADSVPLNERSNSSVRSPYL